MQQQQQQQQRAQQQQQQAQDQDVQWYYRTGGGSSEVFGPFSSDDMAYWYGNGDLPATLEVRRGERATRWQRLQDLGTDPFAATMAV